MKNQLKDKEKNIERIEVSVCAIMSVSYPSIQLITAYTTCHVNGRRYTRKTNLSKITLYEDGVFFFCRGSTVKIDWPGREKRN